MTAANIRALVFSHDELETRDQMHTMAAFHQAQMLREIAAQLAELNEFLRSDKSVMNVVLCASNDSIPVVIRER